MAIFVMRMGQINTSLITVLLFFGWMPDGWAQTTCTSTDDGSFTDNATWNCSGGSTWASADELIIGHEVHIPNNITATVPANYISILSNGVLEFKANAKLVMTTPNSFIDLAPGAQILTNNSSSGTFIEINGTGVWGNACSGCNDSTLTGPGIINEFSPPEDPLQNTLLPIRWSDVAAEVLAPGVRIRWSVEDVDQPGTFGVQRSADGMEWNTIYTVASGQGKYETVDETARGGAYLYRIAFVPFDGEIEWSPVQQATSQTVGLIRPIGGSSWEINWLNDLTRHYSVFNASGQVVQQGNLPVSATTIRLEVPKGLYWVGLQAPNGSSLTLPLSSF